MPTFSSLRKKTVRIGRINASVVGRKRVLKARKKWGSQRLRIKFVEFALNFRIRDVVADLCKTGSPVVVDWGCGNGVSAAAVARVNPNARVYGFSKDSYAKWNTLLHGTTKKRIASRNLKFIHADAADFGRYFKPNSIDLIYSRLGMSHLQNQFEYVQRIIPKLKIGGILVMDIENNEQFRTFLNTAIKKSTQEEKVNTRLGNRPYSYQITLQTYTFPNFEVKHYPLSTNLQITRTA